MKRIVIYGNFDSTHLGASYQRAFQQQGFEVLPINTRQKHRFLASWINNRLLHRLTIRSLRFRDIAAQQWTEHVASELQIFRPDIFFVINGEFLFPKAFTTYTGPVAYFHADRPTVRNPSFRPEVMQAAKRAHTFFSWSEQLCQELAEIWNIKTAYLPFAWDSMIWPMQKDMFVKYPVTFIGNWDKYREDILCEVAKEFDLRIWGGNYWQTRTDNKSLRKCWQGQEINGAEAARIVASSAISLNILRQQNLPDGTNMRTFELAGAGTVTVSTYSKGCLDIFPEGLVFYFRDKNDINATIRKALALSTSERSATITHVQSIAARHTYQQRAQQILELVI